MPTPLIRTPPCAPFRTPLPASWAPFRATPPRASLASAAAALACLAAGCIGPTYHRPNIPPPAAWNETTTPDTPGAARTADAGPVWPAADWWQGFGSAKLDELIAAAERSNDDLAA